MSSSATRSVNIICPEGDLLLRATREGGETLLLVSSQVMTESSAEFVKLLRLHGRPMTQPSTLTSPMNELWIPEDDGDALLTICNILHGCHQDVPAVIPLEALKNIASSCHRHQLASALSAWSTKWVNGAASRAIGDQLDTVVAVAQRFGISSASILWGNRLPQTPRSHDLADHSLAGASRERKDSVISQD